MGLAKSEWIEAQERGWRELGTHVCANCVDDPYLQGVVKNNADSLECDFCGQKTSSNSAAPVNALMGPIASAVFYYFNEPADAGVPYESSEGGYAVEPTDKGAPKPDIASPEALKRALLNAKAVAHTAPAGGGITAMHLLRMFEKLGIAQEVAAKTKLAAGGPNGRVSTIVASGEADIGLQQDSELMSNNMGT